MSPDSQTSPDRRRRLSGLVALVAAALACAGLAAFWLTSRSSPVRPAVRTEAAATPVVPRTSPTAPERSRVPLIIPPTSVSIPHLHVTAPVVERVGVIRSGFEAGLLSAPANYHHLGWYEHATTGVMVIDGHVGFASGAGPLAYIGELTPGDQVIVHYGTTARTFVVASLGSVVKGNLSPKFFTKSFDGDVMLITCDYQSPLHNGHFEKNVYVIARPVGDRSAT